MNFYNDFGGAGSDTLNLGEALGQGQYLLSSDGRFIALLQTDGNFVVYANAWTVNPANPGGAPVVWATNRGGGTQLVLQGDGNLVVYAGSKAIWASNTNKGARLSMQSDGNLVLYNAANGAVWSSNTYSWNSKAAHPPPPAALPPAAPTPSAPPPPVITAPPVTVRGSYLLQGDALHTSEALQSPSGRYTFVLQPDGNAVVYDGPYDTIHGGHAPWASGTNGSQGVIFTLQKDGNLVLYRADGGVAGFASNTNGQNGNFLTMQDDGNLVLYAVDMNTKKGRAVWDTRGTFDSSWFSNLLGPLSIVFPLFAIPIALSTGQVGAVITAVKTDATAAAQVITGDVGGAINTVEHGIATSLVPNVGPVMPVNLPPPSPPAVKAHSVMLQPSGFPWGVVLAGAGVVVLFKLLKKRPNP